MGCNTVGFVATDNKNPFEIYSRIEKALIAKIRHESGATKFLLPNGWQFPTCELSPLGMLVIRFEYGGERRNLRIHFSCDSDFSDVYNGKKVIFSFGNWGRSVKLMLMVLDAVSDFGDIYYYENDCADEFQKLEHPASA